MYSIDRTAPKLALIDFGLARQLAPGREIDAERRNLDAINIVGPYCAANF